MLEIGLEFVAPAATSTGAVTGSELNGVQIVIDGLVELRLQGGRLNFHNTVWYLLRLVDWYAPGVTGNPGPLENPAK